MKEKERNKLRKEIEKKVAILENKYNIVMDWKFIYMGG